MCAIFEIFKSKNEKLIVERILPATVDDNFLLVFHKLWFFTNLNFYNLTVLLKIIFRRLSIMIPHCRLVKNYLQYCSTQRI